MIASIVGYVLDSAGADPRRTQDVSVPAGETGTISFSIKHRDGTAYDLTGAQLLFAVGNGRISRQATITNIAGGLANVPLVVADTAGVHGNFPWDAWLTLGDGSRYQVVFPSTFTVTTAEGQPGQVVTVPASQQPLALGPQGPAGPPGINGVTSATNSDGSLTISPTVGDVVVSLNPSHANTWTAEQAVSIAAIAAANTVGASLANPTAAIVGAQQQSSPMLEFVGHAWNTGGSADSANKVALQLRPAAGSPTAQHLTVFSSVAGGAYGQMLDIVDGASQGVTGGAIIYGDSTVPHLQLSTASGAQLSYGSNDVAIGGSYVTSQVSGGGQSTVSGTGVQLYTPGASGVVDLNNTTGMGISYGGHSLTVFTSGTTIVGPMTSDSYNTKKQNVTGIASTTIDPTLGSFVKLNLQSAVNVTALTVSAGIDGQELIVHVTQPGAGSAATVATTWTNVSFAGGTGSFTATLGRRDVYRLRYDSATSKWYEETRSLNITN